MSEIHRHFDRERRDFIVDPCREQDAGTGRERVIEKECKTQLEHARRLGGVGRPT